MELLVVLVILGILATVVVFAVRGIVNDGDATVCKSEQQVVGRAVESWFAKNQGTAVPATGVGPDRYEQTLVEAGMIRSTSTYPRLVGRRLVDSGGRVALLSTAARRVELTTPWPTPTRRNRTPGR